MSDYIQLDQLPDYHQRHSWMMRPPQPDKNVDVFYLYPTAYFTTPEGPDICDIDHRAMRLRAQEHVRTKGSVFSSSCNYFVPYYRQVSVECIVDCTPYRHNLLLNGAVRSVLAAFDTYIHFYNQGRPFILAGHSQGSLMLQYLMSLYLKENPQYLKQMIAAYVIGFSITKDWLQKNPHLHFATGRTDTGVIISYNTESPGVQANNITLLPNSCCINPINWRCDEMPAASSESLGSQLVIRDTKGMLKEIRTIPHYADAILDRKRGVVVCSTADSELFRIVGAENYFPEGVLHNGDYSLYYYDLQQNAKDRIAAFFK